MAPMNAAFDLSDAQTVQALNESASCLKAVLEVRVNKKTNTNTLIPLSRLKNQIKSSKFFLLLFYLKQWCSRILMFFNRFHVAK